MAVFCLCAQISPSNAFKITPQSSEKIAFLYANDLSGATAFQSLLNSNGSSTALIKNSTVTSSTFAAYSLIIIGPDTGLWSNTTMALNINSSGAKILGIGEGGYQFFGALSLSIGFPNGMHVGNAQYTNFTSYFASNFNTPFAVLAGNTTVFNSPVDLATIYFPSIPSNVKTLSSYNTGGGHYDIVQQGNRYIQWGFNGSAGLFTSTGSKAFIDVVKYLYPLPSAPRNLQATGGNAQVILTWQVPSNNGGAAITGYKVYSSTTSGAEMLLATIGNVTTYTVTSLTNGQVYYFKVSAVAVSEGPLSNEASATPAGSSVPGFPVGIVAFALVLALLLLPIIKRKKLHC